MINLNWFSLTMKRKRRRFLEKWLPRVGTAWWLARPAHHSDISQNISQTWKLFLYHAKVFLYLTKILILAKVLNRSMCDNFCQYRTGMITKRRNFSQIQSTVTILNLVWQEWFQLIKNDDIHVLQSAAVFICVRPSEGWPLSQVGISSRAPWWPQSPLHCANLNTCNTLAIPLPQSPLHCANIQSYYTQQLQLPLHCNSGLYIGYPIYGGVDCKCTTDIFAIFVTFCNSGKAVDKTGRYVFCILAAWAQKARRPTNYTNYTSDYPRTK